MFKNSEKFGISAFFQADIFAVLQPVSMPETGLPWELNPRKGLEKRQKHLEREGSVFCLQPFGENGQGWKYIVGEQGRHSLKKVSASMTSKVSPGKTGESIGLGVTMIPREAWVISMARNKPSAFCCSLSGSSAS